MGGTVGPKPIAKHAPVRVLFIAGTGRSGSTLLAGILGQIDGIFNAGEVRYIWERGLLANRLCGCGRPFRECPVWQEILVDAGSPDALSMSRVQARLTRLRHVAIGRHAGGAEANSYLEQLGHLYRAIAHVTGSQVIVDSSKLPSYGRLVGSLDGVEMVVVQLVRDPRSAAASWAGIKAQPDNGAAGTMQRISPAQSALLWNLWNAAAPRLVAPAAARYITLRYEDFVARPRRSVERIVELLDMSDAKLPFIDANTVDLAPNHTVSGNPDRLKSGRTVIRTDDAASKRVRKRDRMLVTALTLPLLGRYGYGAGAGGNGAGPQRIGIQHLPEPLRTWRRIQRHLAWAGEDGVGRLVEEDQLDPRERITSAMRRSAWRRRNPIPPGSTIPVYLVGLQRSGTNMVARALAVDPEFEVRNENDREVFDRFRLRPLPEVRNVLSRSRQRFLLLKPLIDSHRVVELLGAIPGKALWTYRSVDGRARSALTKFGEHNLQVVRAIADGRIDVWQGERISSESRALLRSLDVDRISPETAAALIWYLRNTLFFELGLHRREDCLLISYEAVLARPERELKRVCTFLGAEFKPEMTAGIALRGSGGAALEIDPLVRRQCSELEKRLEAQWSSLATL